MTRLKKYITNGALMTSVALALRGLAVAFNAYISQKIGAEALGLYTLLGSVYSFALTLALSGINLTTTCLVSDALGEKMTKKSAFR
jgi:stage V sporulation protein B